MMEISDKAILFLGLMLLILLKSCCPLSLRIVPEPEGNPVREDKGGNRSSSIGGSWGSSASGCLTYNFPINSSLLYSDTMGFRVVRSK